jgi:hypothetical protein
MSENKYNKNRYDYKNDYIIQTGDNKYEIKKRNNNEKYEIIKNDDNEYEMRTINYINMDDTIDDTNDDTIDDIIDENDIILGEKSTNNLEEKYTDDSFDEIDDEELSDKYLFYSNVIINKYYHIKNQNEMLKKKIKNLEKKLINIKNILHNNIN